MKRNDIVLSVALGLLACAGPFLLAQETSQPNDEWQRSGDVSCENCRSHPIELHPKSNTYAARLLVPDDVPLNFSALRIDLGNSGFQGGSFLLRNDGSAGLVTLVVSWSFQGKGVGSSEDQARTVIDSWVTDQAFLQPNSERREDLTFQIFSRPGQALRRATGTVLYAQFDDGTRLGPGVDTVGVQLRTERTKALAASRQLLGKIQSDGDQEAITRYLQATPELRWLREIYEREGLDGLVAEITRPRYLAP